MLSDGGIVFIHTPNVAYLGKFLQYIFRRKKMVDNFRHENLWSLHLQEYDYQSLEKLLNFCGLRVIEVIPTQMKIPLLKIRSKRLASIFPYLADTILLKCTKCQTIDVEKQIDYWAGKE